MRAWLVAARPPTLLAAVAPVLVGSGLAWGDRVFRLDAFLVTLLAALLINVAANFANDASDHARGADGPERIGPPRAVASGLLTPRQVWAGTAVVFTLAAGCGLYLAWISGWQVIAIGAAAIVATLAYTGGPWPYGYRGLGEAFVFLFFGVAAVVGSRFVHDATAPREAWVLAVPVGLLAAAILTANNTRDIDTDGAAGKRTMAVRLGRRGSRIMFCSLLVSAFVTIGIAVASGLVAAGALLAMVALPLAIVPARLVLTEESGPELVRALKATARLHAAVGLLLGVGVAL